MNDPCKALADFEELLEKGEVKPEDLEKLTRECEIRRTALYAMFFGGGESEKKGVTEKDVCPKELKMGIEVEKEHVKLGDTPLGKDIARKIALDHLAEMPDYYTKLKKMEEG